MYDGIATLIGYGPSEFDEYLNEIIPEIRTEVFVQPRGVYQSEYYNAAQLGLKPSLTLYLTNRADYNNEKVLEFEGRKYDVIRVDWSAQRDGISLVCEERIENGKNSQRSGPDGGHSRCCE